jgi:hypothetical protein
MSNKRGDFYSGDLEKKEDAQPKLYGLWDPSKEIRFAQTAPGSSSSLSNSSGYKTTSSALALRSVTSPVKPRSVKQPSVHQELYESRAQGGSSDEEIQNRRAPSGPASGEEGSGSITNDYRPPNRFLAQAWASRRGVKCYQNVVRLSGDNVDDAGLIIFEDAVLEEELSAPKPAVRHRSGTFGRKDIVRFQNLLRFTIHDLMLKTMQRILTKSNQNWSTLSRLVYEGLRSAKNWRARLKMLLVHSESGLLGIYSDSHIHTLGNHQRQHISMFLFRYLSGEQQCLLQRQRKLYKPHAFGFCSRRYAYLVRSGQLTLLPGSTHKKTAFPTVPKSTLRRYHGMTDDSLEGPEISYNPLDAGGLCAADTAGATQGSSTPSSSFRIPKEKLKEAMMASRETNAAYWRYTLYENSDGQKVKVHYCKSKETTERTAQLFLGEEVIGFDIEWKPQASAAEGVKNNVSLIQIASEERIALFHIARYSKCATSDDFVAPTLKRIMESPSISKVGVAIKADCTRLRKFMGIEARGLFELSHLHTLIMFSTGNLKKVTKKLVSLAAQVEEHLQLPLFKGEVRSSDWSQELNYEQIKYAASDTYAGLQLYHVMESKRVALKPTPPLPYHAELNLPIRLGDGCEFTTDDEEDVVGKLPSDRPLAKTSVEELSQDLLSIKIEDNLPPTESTVPQPALTRDKATEVITADTWVLEFRNSHSSNREVISRPRATPAQLRAYSLWHHQYIAVTSAAQLLRDPPLKTTTVGGYILEAIRLEKLPYDAVRLKEVLVMLGRDAMTGRYRALWKLVE